MGWMASNPTQFNSRNTESIARSKKGTYIISTSNVLKNENNWKKVLVCVIFRFHFEMYLVNQDLIVEVKRERKTGLVDII